MNFSNYKFTLDMHTAQSQVSLPVVLNDTARKFYISLSDGGKSYHIADGCLALIRINRPTGTYVEHFCSIEDNTNIVYDLSQFENTAIIPGVHDCEVTLYGLDDKEITTARFTMVVSERVVNSDDIEIKDENWTMLDEIGKEEARRQAWESARKKAETQRDDAEKERVAAEKERETNTAIAIEAANAVAAELLRKAEDGEFNGKDGKDGVDGKDGADGKDGVNGKDGKDGTSVTITDIKESSVDGGNNVISFSDGNKLNIKNGSTGSPGTGGGGGIDADQLNAAVEEALQEAKESGEFDGEKGDKGDHGSGGKPVTTYGAKGDGKTDDTAAFKSALAENRIVFVPGGTYKLTSGITIGDNCCLELAQDAVLNFTNTTGNCITLGMLSNLKGNHATIKVPYEFSGNVLYAYSNTHTNDDINAVPPFTKWDPQWKSGRYVTDVNICKADSRGFHYAVEPEDCKGTAVYISADNTTGYLTFMWGVHYSGLRIAGAFAHGIYCKNIDNGWLHEMRIDAFIDACEIGVQLENCSQVYVSAAIQPRRAYSIDEVYAPYAKHGIKLVNSKNVDLSGSRVWDWENEDKASTTANEKMTLWSPDNEYQSYAMYGDCTGAILNDFVYHTKGDTRKRIYTDNDHNLETVTIIQEPIDRWFKVIGGEAYFNSGIQNVKLLREDALDQFIHIDAVKSYTDVLQHATEADDTTIFNGIGYQIGKRFVSLGSGTDLTDSVYYMTTGFIKIQRGQTLYGKDLTLDDTAKGYAGIVYYNANHERFGSLTAATALKNDGYWTANYQSTGTSFSIQFPAGETLKNLAYVRLVFPMTCVGKDPTMAIDEEMFATYEGFLSDNIKVKGENVIGDIGVETPDWVATKELISGGAVLLPQQSINFTSSSVYSGVSFTINTGLKYDIYWNGEHYRCIAFEQSNGEQFLGNADLQSVASIKENPDSNKNAPFLFFGSNDKTFMLTKNTSDKETVTLKVEMGAEYKYNKMPPEYLPDGVVKSVNGKTPDGNGNVTIEAGGGSANIDVTAEVGQTIVVEEVDASGKPTKWKAAEYQPRTHYQGVVEIYNATLTGLTESEVLMEGFFMQAGETYHVTWNGVEYTCVCIEVPDAGGTCYIGNGVYFGLGDTGEPFCILYGTEDGVNFFALAVSGDGIDEATVVIKGTGYIPIPQQYLGNAFPYCINLSIEYDDNGSMKTVTCAETVSLLEAIYQSGRPLVAQYQEIDESNAATYLCKYPLASAMTRPSHYAGTIFSFSSPIVQQTSGGGYITPSFALFPNADGTYSVESYH